MNSDFLQDRPLPLLPKKICRVYAKIIGYLLTYGYLIVGIIIWYKSDWFIAFGTLLLSFIITGIIKSKLRQISIPPQLREFHYSDYEVASWYLLTNHCIFQRQ